MNRLALSALILLGLCGCRPDTNEIGQQVSVLLQQKINEDQLLHRYGLVVTGVEVIREEGNKYKGVATVMMNGEAHDVGLNILADGNNVMYETDPASFLFVSEQPPRQSPRLANEVPTEQPHATENAVDPQQTNPGGVIGEFDSTSR